MALRRVSPSHACPRQCEAKTGSGVLPMAVPQGNWRQLRWASRTRMGRLVGGSLGIPAGEPTTFPGARVTPSTTRIERCGGRTAPMPLETRRKSDGTLRPWWYGRFQSKGQRHCINLGVPIERRPPRSLSLRDRGDPAFERVPHRTLEAARARPSAVRCTQWFADSFMHPVNSRFSRKGFGMRALPFPKRGCWRRPPRLRPGCSKPSWVRPREQR